MTGHPIRRALAVLAAAALVAAVASTALAGDVDQAGKRKVKCDGKVATKVGTPGNDVIRGTARNDVIAGLGGNDIILGGGGNDIICGGPGNDRLTGNAGHDKLIGEGGRDRLFGGTGVDRLFGGLANDFLAGQAGPDVLGGGPGSDRLDGGIGVDLCAQNTGTGPMVRCELPKSVFGPPPDSDGDGVPDKSDACPSRGDQGFGLDGRGCPFANSYHAKCAADGGWYDEDTTATDHEYWCAWDKLPPYANSDAFFDAYEPSCFFALNGEWLSTNYPDVPTVMVCEVPLT